MHNPVPQPRVVVELFGPVAGYSLTGRRNINIIPRRTAPCHPIIREIRQYAELLLALPQRLLRPPALFYLPCELLVVYVELLCLDLELLLFILERLLCILPIGDVGLCSEPSGYRAVLIQDRPAPGKEPAVTAVLNPQGENVIAWLPRLDHRLPYLGYGLNVVGVDDLLPAPPLQLLQRHARIIVTLFVEPEYPAVRVRHPRQDWNVVGDGMEPLLAIPQRILHSLPPGDVVAHGQYLHNVPVLIADGLIRPGDPQPVPVLTHVLVDVRTITLGVPLHILHYRFKVAAGGLGHGHDHAHHVPAQCLVPGIAEQLFRILVEER